jgi:hypothetical protein
MQERSWPQVPAPQDKDGQMVMLDAGCVQLLRQETNVLHVSRQYDNGIKLRVVKTLGYLQDDDVSAVKIVAGMHKDDWDRLWIVNRRLWL